MKRGEVVDGDGEVDGEKRREANEGTVLRLSQAPPS